MGIDVVSGTKPNYVTSDGSRVASAISDSQHFVSLINNPIQLKEFELAIRARQKQAEVMGNKDMFDLYSGILNATKERVTKAPANNSKFDSNNLYSNYGVSPV